MKRKLLFLSDYYLEDGINGGAERSDAYIIQALSDIFAIDKLHTRNSDTLKAHWNSIDKNGYDVILLSNRVQLSRESRELILTWGIPYYIIERDCQFVKSRNVASYKGYAAPPSQINNAAFYNSANAVFALCESHYAKIMLNLPQANVVNLGSTHIDISERSLFESLSGSEKKHIQRVGVPKIKDWRNAARVVKLMYPESIIEYIDTSSNRKEFLTDIASYSVIAFKPLVYESFSRFCLECRMLGCTVITENRATIGFFDSDFWKTWDADGCCIDRAFERIELSVEMIKSHLNHSKREN